MRERPRRRGKYFYLNPIDIQQRRKMQDIWQNEAVIAQAQLLARSWKHWTGRELLPGSFSPEAFSEKLFRAPFVVLSHGAEPDPILNYGNAAALALWEMTWDEFIRTPSRLTAEASARAERARLLATVAAQGFAEGYSGVRISKSGRRFRIARATVWNLISETGAPRGQAAMFAEWEYLTS